MDGTIPPPMEGCHQGFTQQRTVHQAQHERRFGGRNQLSNHRGPPHRANTLEAVRQFRACISGPDRLVQGARFLPVPERRNSPGTEQSRNGTVQERNSPGTERHRNGAAQELKGPELKCGSPAVPSQGFSIVSGTVRPEFVEGPPVYGSTSSPRTDWTGCCRKLKDPAAPSAES